METADRIGAVRLSEDVKQGECWAREKSIILMPFCRSFSGWNQRAAQPGSETGTAA